MLGISAVQCRPLPRKIRGEYNYHIRYHLLRCSISALSCPGALGLGGLGGARAPPRRGGERGRTETARARERWQVREQSEVWALRCGRGGCGQRRERQHSTTAVALALLVRRTAPDTTWGPRSDTMRINGRQTAQRWPTWPALSTFSAGVSSKVSDIGHPAASGKHHVPRRRGSCRPTFSGPSR